MREPPARLLCQPVSDRRGGRNLLCVGASERNAHLWVERTPSCFLFNIKAFSLFTHHPVPVERLPEAVKELLPHSAAEKNRVYLSDVPEEARTLIWQMQVQALAPLAAAGKLGCMLFQFPHWFTARRDNIDYLQRLRERTAWPIAVEFRGGGWMTDNYQARTLILVEKLGVAYLVVDEPQGFRSSTPPVAASTSRLAVPLRQAPCFIVVSPQVPSEPRRCCIQQPKYRGRLGSRSTWPPLRANGAC